MLRPLQPLMAPSQSGFGARLQSGLTSQEPANEAQTPLVTSEELKLLKEWPVENLTDILNLPDAALDTTADDYLAFHEQAGRMFETIVPLMKDNAATIRFGVGGASWDIGIPFDLDRAALNNRWRYERPIACWVRKHAQEIEAIAKLGRPYALASASLDVQTMSGVTREEAVETGCYASYLRQIYLRAFNLFGINPLPVEELGINGIDPWMQIVASPAIDPTRCTGQQLQRWAKTQFFTLHIPFECYSILAGLPNSLSIAERMQMCEWRVILEKELSQIWLQGNDSEWLEATLNCLLDPANASASAS